MITTAHLTITTAATLVATGPAVVHVQPEIGQIAIGNASVTFATGYALAVPGGQPFTVERGDSLFAVVGTGTGILQILTST